MRFWHHEEPRESQCPIHVGGFKRATVAPTILRKGPFGENVERLSLYQAKIYVVQCAVQTDAIQQLAADGRMGMSL